MAYKQRVSGAGEERWTERFSKEIVDHIRKFVSSRPLDAVISNPPTRLDFLDENTRWYQSWEFYNKRLSFYQKLLKLHNSFFWVNVGTWDLPKEKVDFEHIKAWRLSWENDIRRRPSYQKRAWNEARVEAIRSYVRGFTKKGQGNAPDPALAGWLFLEFRRQMVVDLLKIKGRPGIRLPPDFDLLIEYLRNKGFHRTGV